MIKKCIIVALTVALSICPSLTVSGQQDPQQSEDQKIEALKKRQLELKRQIREELERQNKALEEELDQLKLGSTKPKATDVSTPTTASTESVTTPGPSAPASSLTQGNGNGNGNGAGVGPTVTSHSAVVAASAATTTSSAPQTNPTQSTACALVIASPRNFSRAEQAVCFLSSRHN